MTYLFVPPDDYWDSVYADIKNTMDGKVNVLQFEQQLAELRAIQGGQFTDIKVNIMGIEAVIISAEPINTVIDTIRGWIRGVMFVLLLLYNYNQVHRLIRGNDLVSTGKIIEHIRGDIS